MFFFLLLLTLFILLPFFFNYFLQIQNKNLINAKEKIENSKKDAIITNEKKYKIIKNIVDIKKKMVKEITDFSSELSIARNDISQTQEVVLENIRIKLHANEK